MKAMAKRAFWGSVLSGLIAQIAVLACGRVASSSDANAARDTAVGVDGTAAALAFAGFSYHTDGFVKMAGWNAAIIDVLDYNTFTSMSYNVQTGIFTVPMAGYYKF